MSVHVEKLGIYLAIFASLLVLTALTVWVAFYDFPGILNDVIALAIAFSKATLVVLFFMHVRHSTRLTKVVVAGALLWVVFLFLFTLADYLSRGWLGVLGK